MNISHHEYLESILESRKMELDEVHIKHRIDIAVYETKISLLNKQIDSIELQLSGISDKELPE